MITTRPLGPHLAMLLALLLPGRTVAQEPLGYDPNFGLDGVGLEATEEAPPVYHVEVLIFANTEFSRVEESFAPKPPQWPAGLRDGRVTAAPQTLQPGSADWYLDSLTLPRAPGTPTGLPPPATATTGPLVDEFGNTLTTTTATDEEGRWYRLLARDGLQLDGAFNRLNALGAYTPLVHAAWSQAALLEDAAQPFELGFFGIVRPSGTIRLHRSRFLHLTIDLTLQDDYRYRSAPAEPGVYRPLAELMRPLQFRLRTNRRVRSDELHFFDHPAFGVLIMVRPAPEPVQPGAAGGTGPAA